MSEDNVSKSLIGDIGEDFDQTLYDKCEQFCQRLRRSNQHIYKQFSNIVSPGVKNAKEQLGDLLSEDPELLREVNSLLEDEAKFKSQRERISEHFQTEANKAKALEGLMKMIQTGQIDGQTNREVKWQRCQYINEQLEGESQLQQAFNNTFKKKTHEPTKAKAQENRNYFTKLLEKCVDLRNELAFWDKFRNRVMQQFPQDCQQFMDEFLKILHLYSECIITQIEFMELVNQHQDWLEREFIDEIRSMATSRIIMRRMQTLLFKPLKDTDFSTSERLTRSYVRMPSGYARAKPNHELNHTWVSVPFGSEDQSFLIMRKNTFEEQLFKSEDERFEFDMNILQIKRTIKLLSEIVENNRDDPVLVAKVIEMRIVQQLYRNQNQDQNEILHIFQMRPVESGRIILKRVKSKLIDLTTARNSKAKAIWENVSLLNFHRSLDHRSFYFKKNDKLLINSHRFIRDIEENAKTILTRHLGAKDAVFPKRKPEPIPFTQEQGFLNTLSQLTNIRPLLPRYYPLPDVSSNNLRHLPLLALWMGNQQVLQEAAQFIAHYLQIMGGNTMAERRQGTQFLAKTVNVLCQTPLQPMQMNELILSDQQLRSQISELETYDIVYSPDDIIINIPQTLPQPDDALVRLLPSTSTAFYATQNLYVLLRFIHALYQRLEIAHVISKQNPKGQDKRYSLFKSALYLSLKAKDFKYEDYLRSLFGKHGFIFSTLEKVLHDTAKQLVLCIQDPSTSQLFDSISNADEVPFDSFFSTVIRIMNQENITLEEMKTQVFYKFNFLPDDQALLNLYDQLALCKAEKKPIYRVAIWHQASFISLLPAYINSMVEPGQLYMLPFLRRNLITESHRVMESINGIEWIVEEDSHLRPICDGEDYLNKVLQIK